VQTAIVVFDSDVNLAHDFSFDSAPTEAYLKAMMDGPRRNMEEGDRRGAAIYDAVRYSVKLLEKQPDDSRRVLLLISEPRDHGSHAVKLDDAIAAINDCNTIVSPTRQRSAPTTAALSSSMASACVSKDTGSNFTIEYYTYLRADDVAGSSANAQINLVHPMFSRLTYLSATIPLVNSATQYTGLSLQNTNALIRASKLS
jgi:hypothetical protein